ncbi:RNA-directed DNA polymerase, eukaryota, partial [Tanacetum coccineum]
LKVIGLGGVDRPAVMLGRVGEKGQGGGETPIGHRIMGSFFCNPFAKEGTAGTLEGAEEKPVGDWGILQ